MHYWWGHDAVYWLPCRVFDSVALWFGMDNYWHIVSVCALLLTLILSMFVIFSSRSPHILTLWLSWTFISTIHRYKGLLEVWRVQNLSRNCAWIGGSPPPKKKEQPAQQLTTLRGPCTSEEPGRKLLSDTPRHSTLVKRLSNSALYSL